MNYQEQQKNIVLNRFSNSNEVTTKVITTDQFKQQYGNGFKVFTREGVQKAINDASNILQKGIGADDLIKSLTNEINGCEKVYVTNGKMTDVLLVKAYTAEEIEKAQKSDIDTEDPDVKEKEGDHDDDDTDEEDDTDPKGTKKNAKKDEAASKKPIKKEMKKGLHDGTADEEKKAVMLNKAENIEEEDEEEDPDGDMKKGKKKSMKKSVDDDSDDMDDKSEKVDFEKGERASIADESKHDNKSIGKTTSGKPVYKTTAPTHPIYKNFTLDDHKEASKLHKAAATETDNDKIMRNHMSLAKGHLNMTHHSKFD